MMQLTSSMCVFGEDWGAHPSSTQHLMTHLSRTHEVLWINSIGLRSPRLSRDDLGRLWRKGRAIWSGDRNGHRQGNVATAPFPVTTVKAIPAYGSGWSEAINRRLIRASLAPRLATFSQAPLLWTSLPSALPAVGHCGEKGVVYYCGDDFSALAGVDHAAIAKMENKLVERADLLLVASERLADKFARFNPVTLPHGVDVELFATPAPRATDLPDSPRIAGFYGSLASWIDVELLAGVARRLPQWQFVLVGNINTDVSLLSALSNVHLLGARPHSALPGYVQHWQASLLPFRDCEQIRACNPLKLREYLAAGAPLVATPFPALEPYRSVIAIAEGVDAFAAAIAACDPEALGADAVHATLMRRGAVENESWCRRAEEINTCLGNRGLLS